MDIKKVKIRKIKEPFNLATGDLIFHKRRKCEITILRINNTFSGYDVIYHDYEFVGGLPLSAIQDHCYYII